MGLFGRGVGFVLLAAVVEGLVFGRVKERGEDQADAAAAHGREADGRNAPLVLWRFGGAQFSQLVPWVAPLLQRVIGEV